MQLSADFFEHTRRQADLLLARVITRDNVHLSPVTLSRAAAKRLRAGIAVIEAYLRRVLLLLALHLEPTLTANQTEYVKYRRDRTKARSTRPAPRFRLFYQPRDWPGIEAALSPLKTDAVTSQTSVFAAPLLARLAVLKTLIDAPETRARRLAYHLARRCPGLLLAPGRAGQTIPARYGTEVSALFNGMASAILTASRDRPAPLGPRPRAPPRISML